MRTAAIEEIYDIKVKRKGDNIGKITHDRKFYIKENGNERVFLKISDKTIQASSRRDFKKFNFLEDSEPLGIILMTIFMFPVILLEAFIGILSTDETSLVHFEGDVVTILGKISFNSNQDSF